MTLDELNNAPVAEAAAALRACAHSTRWVNGLLRRRPYASFAALLEVADAVWRTLGPNDWREAMASHPRIGERAAASADELSRGWSAAEQSGVDASDATARRELAAANREYEARFGHTFLICASGKRRDEILASLRDRLRNAPDVELGVAAEELRRIARLRLERLLGNPITEALGR